MENSRVHSSSPMTRTELSAALEPRVIPDSHVRTAACGAALALVLLSNENPSDAEVTQQELSSLAKPVDAGTGVTKRTSISKRRAPRPGAFPHASPRAHTQFRHRPGSPSRCAFPAQSARFPWRQRERCRGHFAGWKAYERNLQKLSLFGDISILQQHGSISNTYLGKVDPDGKKIKQIQQLFEEILGNSRQLKWLSCGFMLQIVTPTSLSSLSNPIANTMEHLSLLDNHIPGNTTLITAVELERFVNLRSLALDFCDFTAEMARVLADSNHVPLHRLSLLVHSVSIMHKSLDSMPEDENWKALTRNSTNLRVYIMAFDVKSDDMLRILKPSIPLERIHFDSYITCVSGAVVDLISRQYDKFLTHFILMNDVIDMSGFPDLSDNRNEDPLVLLAWRCTRLSLLAVHGYTVWAHNLIAIARLRGSDLKVLEVTEESIDFDQGELADQDVDPVHNLIEQVSLGLGRPWHAVMDIELLSVFTEPTRHFYREMQSFSEGI
ncbi:PREDICTED: F-box only protein 33 [Nipponia nippon]|uniref:F-box only protein 33 n=1 Tax=Nipponia nippon TaxID=128390 RepID=UPI00051100CC|nr:PREDICTED: F-box only protein 33 [Nipponia nippon]